MATIVEFEANDVVLTPITGFVGFSNSDSSNYFWLQPGETVRGLSPDKSEIWLERDDQEFGGAGGNWNIAVTRNLLKVDTRELPWMKCDAIIVRFELNDAQYNSLKELLQKVMKDCLDDLHVFD